MSVWFPLRVSFTNRLTRIIFWRPLWFDMMFMSLIRVLFRAEGVLFFLIYISLLLCNSEEFTVWAISEVTQQIKMLAAKPDRLRLNPGIYMVEGEIRPHINTCTSTRAVSFLRLLGITISRDRVAYSFQGAHVEFW